MARFNWADMTTPIDNSQAINIALPVGGAFLLQSALTAMDKRYQWQDDGDDISDSDWDNLQALLADIMLAIMTEIEVEMGVPIGFVIPFCATTTPENWLLCDGDQYLRVDYPDLYDVLPPQFIVDADNFVVPDASERYIFGIGTNEFTAVGELKGTDEIVLTIANLPPHYHLISVVDAGGAAGNTIKEGAAGSVTGLVESLETGGAEPFTNLSPSIAMPYYIRAL